MLTYAKRLFGVLFGFIFLLFSLLGLLMPLGKALTCTKTNKTCEFITRYAFRESQTIPFNFSEFIDAQAIYTHSGNKMHYYGVEIETELGTVTVADFSKQEAEESALKLNTYIKNPHNSVFTIDSNDDLVTILGIFVCLFCAVASFAVAIFNILLTKTSKV